MKPALHLIVPVFNERANAETWMARTAEILQHLENYRPRLIFVDDGSTDGTADALRQASRGQDLTVLSHPVNRGPGAAVRTAFEWLHGSVRDEDAVVTLEGDNSSNLALITDMLERRGQGASLVLADPEAAGGGFAAVPAWRIGLSRAGNFVTRSLFRAKGRGSLSNFFRLHGGELIRRLQASFGPGIVESDGFAWAAEIFFKASLTGARPERVPARIDWTGRRGGSKMRVLRTAAGYAQLFFSVPRWRRMAGTSGRMP